ncbi:MAG: heavy metal-responsive transcriptional regulator [Chloroflexota bacterium]
MEMMTRGELARYGQVNPETIRYYERSGLLPLPARSESNYRLFAPAAAQRIRFIKRAQAVGFSLDEIRTLLDLKFGADATCGDVRGMVDTKIEDIDHKIAALQAMRDELSVLFEECPGGDRPTEECPILESFTHESS